MTCQHFIFGEKLLENVGSFQINTFACVCICLLTLSDDPSARLQHLFIEKDLLKRRNTLNEIM